MQWFRFYHEFRHDTKMRRMPIPHRYAFVVLLCLASESSTRGIITGLDDEDIAFELEMEVEDWQTLKGVFAEDELIATGADGRISIVGWEYNQKYRDRPPAHVWRDLREHTFHRDNYTCQYCGERGGKLHCDHVIPLSRGGSNKPGNLATACAACNLSKHNKTIEEWMGSLL